MNSSVIVFPGSNCDRDIAVALEKLQFKNKMIWHKETKLPKSDLIVIPGGFSYGDYLRSGAIAGKSLIINEVIKSLNDIPFVTVAHITTGKFNIFCKVRAHDTKHAKEIIFMIDDIDGVSRTETMISLEESINDKKRLMHRIFNEL